MTNKRMGPHGFYMADISIAGKFYKDKTFFPQEWSQEKVIHKIYEAYDEFLKSGAKNFTLKVDGKFHAVGELAEKTKINIVLTKSGHAKTVYPIFPKGTI